MYCGLTRQGNRIRIHDRQRVCSETHRSEAYRLAYVETSVEHPQSSPGPKPRPGRPLAITCPFAQILVLFSTFSSLLLVRWVLPTTQNFQTLKPLKTLPTSMPHTIAHTFLNKLHLSHGAERSFMNILHSDQCSHSSLHSTFCATFTTKELTIAVFRLLTSTASGPDLISLSKSEKITLLSQINEQTANYPLLTHLLLQRSNIFSPSSTGPGLLTPFPSLLLKTCHNYPLTQTCQLFSIASTST